MLLNGSKQWMSLLLQFKIAKEAGKSGNEDIKLLLQNIVYIDPGNVGILNMTFVLQFKKYKLFGKPGRFANWLAEQSSVPKEFGNAGKLNK